MERSALQCKRAELRSPVPLPTPSRLNAVSKILAPNPQGHEEKTRVYEQGGLSARARTLHHLCVRHFIKSLR